MAKSALRKGMVELALMRYGMALGILTTLFTLAQTQEIDLSQKEEMALAGMIQQLEDEAELIVADWGNGHRNPPRHEVANVGLAILKELDRLR
jgi:hypothetical protein